MTDPLPGVPPLARASFADLSRALRLGLRDMIAAPGYGFLFSLPYVLAGWGMVAVTWLSGQVYWLIFAAISFPLIGPFAAVGLYEVSRRLHRGLHLDLGPVLLVIVRQGRRQLPSLCAVILILFLFWFFLGHMIFALFLGLSAMTNVSTSMEVFVSPEGLAMLAVGGLVGAGFALLLYMITVIALPLLLDREVDFVTAMIASFGTVTGSPVAMLAWGVFVAAVTAVAMLPAFLGLFVVLPWLGHATWHLYAGLAARPA
ncbi:DUF2189 domain-containing protein [Pseudooceanicola sp. 216_PA32_1]|uniref:DUF2189 domain-containing protein n=1 Tax=Pseudooceanicola pacificus TaxID=2676438 RepID=A0A844W8Y7_9RHOB|nr:DUF2189 domain-containing protein [Pseudooceanicola pacificus]MWB79615.1 DUF2189 domain-containing protein [Pseudooceanicola pacificus]